MLCAWRYGKTRSLRKRSRSYKITVCDLHFQPDDINRYYSHVIDEQTVLTAKVQRSLKKKKDLCNVCSRLSRTFLESNHREQQTKDPHRSKRFLGSRKFCYPRCANCIRIRSRRRWQKQNRHAHRRLQNTSFRISGTESSVKKKKMMTSKDNRGSYDFLQACGEARRSFRPVRPFCLTLSYIFEGMSHSERIVFWLPT